jgi:8-oxo-dGTP diphosphatase
VATDHLDLVRDYFHALNHRDLERVAAVYHEVCETEHIVPGDDAPEPRRGRREARRLLEGYFASYEGGFAGGAHYRVRTLAAIETGWVHAEWIERDRRRGSGEVLEFVGYSHFLIEDGLIRRHRTVRQTVDAADAEEPPPGPSASSRRYPSRPVVGVGAVVLVDGRVVLVKRRYEPLAGQWSLPGGSLEVGETLEAGVAREIFEETGLQVEVGPVIEVFDRILLDEDKKVRYHFVLVDYLCRPVGGELTPASDVADVALVDPAALEPYGLTPKATSIIRKAVALHAAASPRA